MDLAAIVGLINALSPFVAPATVGVEHVIGALQGAGVMTEGEADADLRLLIAQALAAKAEADVEAGRSR